MKTSRSANKMPSGPVAEVVRGVSVHASDKKSALPKPLKRAIPQPSCSTVTRQVLSRKENLIPKHMPTRTPLQNQPPAKRLRTDSLAGISVIKAQSKILGTKCGSSPVTKLLTAAEGEKKPKRAAWDIKGKLQDAEAALKLWREKYSFGQGNILQLQEEKRMLCDDLNAANKELSTAHSTIGNLQCSLDCKEKELAELTLLKKQLELNMEEKISKLQKELHNMEVEFEQLNTKLRAACEESQGKSLAIEQLQAMLRNNETLRRQLHNTIQELKGNIRVYCRVRPLLPDETGQGQSLSHLCFPEHNVIQMQRISESTTNDHVKTVQKYEFKFDRVFDCDAGQSDVFDEVTHLVQSSLDGFNICLFAYGQTGSGKTYTMEGPSDLELDTGIIQRAVEQIFVKVKELKDKGWEYVLEVSAVEIYNEAIRDLLSAGHENLKMYNHTENMTVEAVTSEQQVHALLRKSRKQRAVAATLCNQHSSRSHCVFSIKITGENPFTRENCQGTLNLVDLAGSERLKESGSEGDRLTETKNINRSLSNLKTVIMALVQKRDHIPYRDSKLTYLLRNSLGGNSKTLMIVAISPRLDHFGETLNSLRFATQVNQCHIGTATKVTKQ